REGIAIRWQPAADPLRQRQACDNGCDGPARVDGRLNPSKSARFDLAQQLNKRLLVRKQKELIMNRLDTIATRQKKSFSRDILFACFVALAAIVSVTTVSTAVDAAQVAHR